MEKQQYVDAVIIGGSYAGLSAAMALGRALRRVLIIDSGKPCNRQTPYSHNFLTQDGRKPAVIAAQAREQVMAYPTIQWLDDEVMALQGKNLQFTVQTLSGKQFHAKKILFATGLQDRMPAIEGFEACWGISVIHCPYCHGYEYRDRPTGLLINGNLALEKAKMIRNWTKKLTIFTNGPSTIPSADAPIIQDLGIELMEAPIQQILHKDGYLYQLILQDGSQLAIEALYASLPVKQHCLLPEQLGCALKDSGHIEVNSFQQTSIPGVYAAGDNSNPMRSVAVAVAAGTMGGAFINHDLISENV